MCDCKDEKGKALDAVLEEYGRDAGRTAYGIQEYGTIN